MGDELVTTVLAGGYPEALARSGWRRRQDWHQDYVEAIVQRDVRDIVQIQKLGVMPQGCCESSLSIQGNLSITRESVQGWK